MTTKVTRDDLQRLQGMTPKLLRALEELFVDTAAAGETAAGAVAATGAIQNATVLTLSSNAAFNNERVLSGGDGITLTVDDATAIISLANLIVLQGGFKCTFNLMADTSIDLPTSGRVGLADPGLYADDAAAAAAGVQVGELYRKASGVVSWRQV